MKNKSIYLVFISITLAAYYILWGLYLNKLGYTNQEMLFYIEKAKIVFEGTGDRLKIMGLTAPILPFYGTFLFTMIDYAIAPVVASAIGTALLFYILAIILTKKTADDFYLVILLIIFVCHPGLLYAAMSGKSIYLVLIFFFLFYHNMLEYYRSNTTFHISIASICFVTLVFCDYNFIWLSLFFIPLILSISLQSLNLGEKESIFRLFLSFNSPSLRRKLINKTFAMYIILFALPLSAVLCYKLLNLTHANNLNYFNESPYATWAVIADKLSFDAVSANAHYQTSDVSILISAKIILYCPLILVAIFLFRTSTYQILTLVTPFAFVEFLHIKYDKIFLPNEYYMIFLMLSLLCIMTRIYKVRNQTALKLVLGICVAIQIYTGYVFLQRSALAEERQFAEILLNPVQTGAEDDNREIAGIINSLPSDSQVLLDDAIAYPISSYTHDIRRFTLPYQDNFLSAIESPGKYDDYVLIATGTNTLTHFTPLSDKYIDIIKHAHPDLNLQKIYESDNWVLYRIL